MRQAEVLSGPDLPAPVRGARRRQIAQVQIARKALGMDETTYRAVLARVTGHDSLTACDLAALERAVAEMRRLGWEPTGKRPLARQAHVRKVYAIWTSMAGLVDDPSQDALRAFVVRQTGVTSPEWLDGVQANKVVEGLKAWRARLTEKAI
jgi:phage gp16-like protein